MKVKFRPILLAVAVFMSFGFTTNVKAVTVKIKEVKNIVVTANQGGAHTLPKTVTAIMTNNTKKSYPVKWNVAKVSTVKVSKQVFYGTVVGYSKKVAITLNVVPVIKEIKEISQNVEMGYNFQLPKTVNAIMTNNTIKSFAVKWSVPKVETQELGNQTIYGTVAGYSKKVALIVNITAPIVVVEPDTDFMLISIE
ncbi:Ig-like domain-containing protein [Clostridium sp. CF012]|uniref:Ig-like domain-containing protein n=1 Tax=Clostridium sp. CF012 TaxID=2843319 RepID=UPI001C0AA913|nr:Ig-like domain-containing protein [Clostridium sp. CF012]MBU3145114.1 Ig-like domain-containing protein [Clostridium sp. CF012]